MPDSDPASGRVLYVIVQTLDGSAHVNVKTCCLKYTLPFRLNRDYYKTMPSHASQKSSAIIVFSLTALVLGLTWVFFVFFPGRSFPADDALILFRYSENLAHTGVIAFNYGEAPVEGATDFLWMVLLAGLYYVGFSTWSGVLLLSLLCLFGTSYIVFRVLGSDNKAVFLLIVLFFLLFRTTFSAIAGFSTLFFGFFIALTIYLDLKNKSKLMFATALITCLVRPDGLVFVVPVIANNLYKNRSVFWTIFSQSILLFFLPGALYFLWRYSYFGLFFPLPFYVKNSSGMINYESLMVNLRFNIPFMLVIVAAILTSVLLRKTKASLRDCIYFAVLFTIPFLFYSKVALIQNAFHRFQHPFVIISLLMLALICKKNNLKKFFIIAVAGLIVYSIPYAYRGCLHKWYSQYVNIYHVAVDVSEESLEALFLTTEAGVLPYYTRWRTVDAFGLNTPAFTRNIISSQHVRDMAPDVVLINHAWDLYRFMDSARDAPEAHRKSWPGMTVNIVRGLDTEHYDIMMLPMYDVERVQRDVFFELQRRNPLFGPYYDKGYYCFFVRKDFVQAPELRNILISHGAVFYSQFKQNIRPALEEEIRQLDIFPQ